MQERKVLVSLLEELTRDMAEAEQLTRRHEELGQEIEEHGFYAQALWQDGQWLLAHSPLITPEVQAQVRLPAHPPKASAPLVVSKTRTRELGRGVERGRGEGSQSCLCSPASGGSFDRVLTCSSSSLPGD